MLKVKPIRIPGRWKEGYALDYHTMSSVYLGHDEYGHPVYDTKRTEIGELLYRLKYKSDRSVLHEIVNRIELFYLSWKPPIDFIIPVLPSRSRKKHQPVKLIAEEMGRRLKIPVRFDCIFRVKEIPAIKNVYEFDERTRLLRGAFKVDSSWVGERKILLFDDLYRSGATMNAITEVLYDEGYADDVYALTITRTRSRT